MVVHPYTMLTSRLLDGIVIKLMAMHSTPSVLVTKSYCTHLATKYVSLTSGCLHRGVLPVKCLLLLNL